MYYTYTVSIIYADGFFAYGLSALVSCVDMWIGLPNFYGSFDLKPLRHTSVQLSFLCVECVWVWDCVCMQTPRPQLCNNLRTVMYILKCNIGTAMMSWLFILHN